MFASTTFWVGVAFFIFLGIVALKGGKSILALLDARSDSIRKTLEEAQSLHEDAQQVLADYKRKQRDAIKEAEDIVDHAKREADRLRQDAETALEVALNRRLQQADEKIKRAEATAIQEVRNTAIEVAITATRTLLEHNVSAAKASALLDDVIAELPKKFH